MPPRQLSQNLVEEWKKVQQGKEHKFVKIAHRELLKGDFVRSKEKLVLSQAKLYEIIDNNELKIIIDHKIEAAGRAAMKKSNNDHRMKLRSLLLHAEQPIPEKLEAGSCGHKFSQSKVKPGVRPKC